MFSCVSKIALCQQMSQKEIEWKIDESFQLGLTVETAIENTKTKISKRNEIIEHITNIEKILIDHEEIYKNKKINLDRDFNTSKDFSRQLNRKYCHYHKTSSHDSKDCFSLQKIRSQQRTDKTNFIKEPEFNFKGLENGRQNYWQEGNVHYW